MTLTGLSCDQLLGTSNAHIFEKNGIICTYRSRLMFTSIHPSQKISVPLTVLKSRFPSLAHNSSKGPNALRASLSASTGYHIGSHQWLKHGKRTKLKQSICTIHLRTYCIRYASSIHWLHRHFSRRDGFFYGKPDPAVSASLPERPMQG